MRLILIIQSLIILAGAYYVYTLTRTPEEPTGQESTSNISIEVKREDEVTETSAEEVSNSTNDEDVTVEGHNDLGMEFPMPDDGELETR